MTRLPGPLNPPRRLLLGPGPSNVPPEVLNIMTTPVLSHLDPAFLEIMDATMGGIRAVYNTTNQMTLPISGTGSAGMEAAMMNCVEPGDRIVVGVCGFFGQRMAEMARRRGAEVVLVEAPWGKPVDLDEIRKAVEAGKTDSISMVHGETSTGVLQPLDDVIKLAREHDALFILDTVATLGGIDVDVDGWSVDLCYSGSQKCLSAPPGLAPLSASPRAMEKVRNRKEDSSSWYLDLSLLDGYWSGSKRVYHHTAPVSMVYALHEALRLVLEEGMDARVKRHMNAHKALVAGLQNLGLEMLVPSEHQLPVVTAMKIPEGIDDKTLRGRLVEEEGIEVAGGLGIFAGKIVRIGLMGHNATIENVDKLLAGLKRILGR
jgi:alanine-glyoxylate transaminase/serine-glyoxylate transaminase/serine-pyruvate transaminase